MTPTPVRIDYAKAEELVVKQLQTAEDTDLLVRHWFEALPENDLIPTCYYLGADFSDREPGRGGGDAQGGSEHTADILIDLSIEVGSDTLRESPQLLATAATRIAAVITRIHRAHDDSNHFLSTDGCSVTRTASRVRDENASMQALAVQVRGRVTRTLGSDIPGIDPDE